MIKIIKNYNNEDLVFIGREDEVEYYLNLSDKNVRGWTFKGLIARTEEDLRDRARGNDIEDTLNIDKYTFNRIYPYLDIEKLKHDMEENWENNFDIVAEEEREGETYYLYNQEMTDIFRFFDENNIKSYEDLVHYFDEVTLNEEEGKKLVELVNQGSDKNSICMSDEEKTAELKAFRDLLLK